MVTINTDNLKIKDLIHEIRGKLVMLDSDLAKLYKFNEGTKYLNRIAKRNIDAFSNNNYFQLSKEEFLNLRCQFVTANSSKSRTLPYVFTEEGVATLSTILKTENSKKISIEVLNAFKNLNRANFPETPEIKDLIYEIRGEQVMFDFDLAFLYEVETKRINEAVKNNPLKFPDNFCWTLTDDECKVFLVEIFDQKIEKRGGRYKNPKVFTEQGVAMLSTILKSKKAIEVSIQIMNAFVAMRKYISTSLIQQRYINDLVIKDNKRIDLLEETFSKFEKKKEATEIYFNGQIFDAYSKIQEIFGQAQNTLTIIDAYADNTILDIIKRLSVDVTIITKPNNLLTKQDNEKYNKQYKNLTVKFDNTFHDRYFILDDEVVYHCGASINRIGYKTFSITLVGDKDLCELLKNKIEKIPN